jgi:dihydrofolate synthase/folylpolyglutamate synthase
MEIDDFVYLNKKTAIFTVLALGFPLTKSNVKKAFLEKFNGRFEEIDNGIIVDGAHNADKIKALIQWIKSSRFTVHGSQKIILVVAFKKGKNWQEMIDLLIKNLPVKKIITTQYFATTDMGKGSAMDSEVIANYLTKDKRLKTKAIKNSQEAVFEAVASRQKDEIVLVTGSLYLVGEARTLWKLPEF